MTLFDLILIAVSLSMDAFAVSICKGLSVRKVSLQHAMICGVCRGVAVGCADIVDALRRHKQVITLPCGFGQQCQVLFYLRGLHGKAGAPIKRKVGI